MDLEQNPFLRQLLFCQLLTLSTSETVVHPCLVQSREIIELCAFLALGLLTT